MKAVFLFLAIAGFAILFISACAQPNTGSSYDSGSSYSPVEYNNAPSPAATAYKGSHSY